MKTMKVTGVELPDSFLSNTCLTAIGPNSNYKLVVSGDNNSLLTLTTSSRRILPLLTNNLEDFMSKFILGSCKRIVDKYGDCGLTSIYLSSRFTHILMQIELIKEVTNASILINAALEETLEITRLNVDITNLNCLFSVCGSLLRSKSLIKNDFGSLERLKIELVKGFFHCFQEDRFNDKLFSNEISQGSEEMMCTEGLLLPYISEDVEDDKKLLKSLINSNDMKVLLLDIQLKDDGKELSQLEGLKQDDLSATKAKLRREMRQVIQYLVKLCDCQDIQIVFNQRVTDLRFREMFNEQNVFVVHRLGRHHMDKLCALSKALPMNTINTSIKMLSNANIGFINDIEFVRNEEDNKSFVMVQGQQCKSRTLRIKHPSEQVCLELEIVLEQTWSALVSLVKQKQNFLLPGAGCFETCLMATIIRKRRKFEESTLVNIVKILSNLAVQKSGQDLEQCQVDQTQNHLWTESPKCSCGQLSLNDHNSTKFINLLEVKCSNLGHSFFDERPLPKSFSSFDKEMVVEQGQLYANMFRMVMETALSLASVGTIVIKETLTKDAKMTDLDLLILATTNRFLMAFESRVATEQIRSLEDPKEKPRDGLT